MHSIFSCSVLLLLMHFEVDLSAHVVYGGSVDYIVLTSVDRDDLPDGGSGHFARSVVAMKVIYINLHVKSRRVLHSLRISS